MSDDEEFDEDEDAELDDEDLDEEELDDEDDDIDALDLDDELPEEVVVDDPAPDGEKIVEAVVAEPEPRAEEDEDEDALDLDEEAHPDDVEAPLDALLQERTASATLEDDEEEVEEEEVELDDRGEGPTKIVPRRPGEFLCASCFLVLPRNQLADEARMLCRDCA